MGYNIPDTVRCRYNAVNYISSVRASYGVSVVIPNAELLSAAVVAVLRVISDKLDVVLTVLDCI